MSKNYISIWINIMTRVISVSIESWSEFSIKDICINISSGGTPSRKVPEYYLNGVHKWIKTQELKDCNIYDTDEHITDAALKNSSAKIYPKNTISMAMYGATVGKLGIMKSECATNQACCNMVVDSTKADYRFLFYSLLYRREELIGLASGAAQQNLNVGVISNFRINLPTLSEQKVIAATLSVLDDMIELNNQINKTLEDMAQAIFKSWFVDFEPFKDGEFEDSELGLIPKGWRVGTIGSLCSNIFSGGTPLTSEPKYWNGIYPWLSSGETRRPIIIKTEKSITDEGIINSSTRLAKKYDIVIASAGQGHTRGQTAITLIDTYINQSVIALSSQAFGYLFCNLKNRYDELRAISDSSSIRGSLTTKILNRFPIILPPKEVLLEFQRIFEVIIEYCGQLAFQNEKLSEIRDILLPKLMTGEIRVPVEEVV
jgi:type I restriction enzyme S subunit